MINEKASVNTDIRDDVSLAIILWRHRKKINYSILMKKKMTQITKTTSHRGICSTSLKNFLTQYMNQETNIVVC